MSTDILAQVWDALVKSLYMVTAAWAIASAIGVPLGVFLATSRRGELFPMPRLNAVLNLVVNAAGSTPFIILVVALIPVTRFIVGTSIGTTAAIVPLSIAGAPYIARVIKSSIREVDQGLIEASLAMGGTPLQIVRKVLLPEALAGVVLGLTLVAVALIAYSAMVGAVGGGGLGDLGIRYGYQRFRVDVMAIVIVILIALVQGVQMLGAAIARRVNKRLRPASRATVKTVA